MSAELRSLLERDHDSLGGLLIELDAELAKPDFTLAFELLDVFWARLAVHIRAEHLHLFPAVSKLPRSSNDDKNLPTAAQVDEAIELLRSDHNFFMTELAHLIKSAREICAGRVAAADESLNFRARLRAIKDRLNRHNSLEEDQVYKWPALFLAPEMVAELNQHLLHELENLPVRLKS
jgi:hypothetical protein